MKKTLNIGCGDRVFNFYPDDNYKCTNFDIRKLEGVDVVGNIKDLSMFKDEEFDFLYASDVLEHEPIEHTVNILTGWYRVLKKGGVLEIRVPNLKTICERYVNGKHDAKLSSWLIMGAGTYRENRHFVIFDRFWLKSLIEPVGFKEVYYAEEGNNFIMKVVKQGV